MNLQQAEKIKSLIASSPILSPQERVEWLQLLELMDDKQLAELEKILGNRKQELGIRNYESASRKPDGQGLIKKQSPTSTPAPDLRQMPSLSHIVNLPKNFEHAGNNAEVRPFFPLKQNLPPKTVEALAPQKQDSRFLGKLKSILSEKELSAGRPQTPLELVEGKQEPAGQSHATIPAKPQPAQQPAIVPPKPKVPVPAAAMPASYGQLDKQLKVKTAVPTFSAGLNFPQTSAKQRAESLASVKAQLPQKIEQAEPKPSAKAVAGKQANFETLDDLVSLDFKVFESLDSDSLAKKIKALAGKFGYFEVIFNLEKSSMFKTYVASGLQALAEGSDFDQLAATSPKVGQYLNRGQFEKFTDLLTKIQTQ